MNEYAQRKIEFYGKPIKAILVYTRPIAIIFLIFNCIGLLLALLNGISTAGVNIVLTLTYSVLLFLSLLSFSLLDKSTFYINIITLAFRIIWGIVVAVTTFISMLSTIGIINKTVNDFAGDNIYLKSGSNMALSAVNGGILIGTIISMTLQLAMVAYLIIVGLQFTKHKDLFFTPYKELEKAYSE